MPGRTLIGARIREHMGIGIVRIRSGPGPDFGQAGGVGKADESQPACVCARNIQNGWEIGLLDTLVLKSIFEI